MHDMFDLIINIIVTPCLGMSIVFTKIGYIHQMLQLSHINLHFDLKKLIAMYIFDYQYQFYTFRKYFYEFQSIFVNFRYIDIHKKISTVISPIYPIYP